MSNPTSRFLLAVAAVALAAALGGCSQAPSPAVPEETADPPETCPYTNDGECDEGTVCPVGTDAADCAVPDTPDTPGQPDDPDQPDSQQRRFNLVSLVVNDGRGNRTCGNGERGFWVFGFAELFMVGHYNEPGTFQSGTWRGSIRSPDATVAGSLTLTYTDYRVTHVGQRTITVEVELSPTGKLPPNDAGGIELEVGTAQISVSPTYHNWCETYSGNYHATFHWIEP